MEYTVVGLPELPLSLFAVEKGVDIEQSLRKNSEGLDKFKSVLKTGSFTRSGTEIDFYNDFIVSPSIEKYQDLKEILKNDTLKQLLKVAGFVFGFEEKLEPIQSEDIRIKTVYSLINSSLLFKNGKQKEAIEELLKIEESLKGNPSTELLRARVMYDRLNFEKEVSGVFSTLPQSYQNLINIFSDTVFEKLVADLWLDTGTALHDLSKGYKKFALLEAIKCYTNALSFYKKEKFPKTYALIKNNIALAYLVMPIEVPEDQLKLSYAVQCLKEVRSIYSKEEDYNEWVAATINMANALQHLPSSNPAKNLVKAIELYDEILTDGRIKDDPIKLAKVLANYGSALAHLGLLAKGKTYLEKSKDIFKQFGFHEEVEIIDEVLEEIEEKMGLNHANQ